MKICFVCSEYPPGPHGGIGTMTRILARYLVKAGHEVRVTGIYQPDFPAPDYEVDQGVQVWRLREPTYRLGWLVGRYQLFQQIAGWSRAGEIEIVDVPDYAGPAAGWGRLPVPVIARHNGSGAFFAYDLGYKTGRVTFNLEKLSARRVDYWCAVSNYIADISVKIFDLPEKARAILFNPVEVPTDQATATERSKHQVVFTGTLTQKKGVVSLIKAWQQVLDRCPEARLDLFGKDGPTEEHGDSMIAYLQSLLSDEAKQTVQFRGHVPRETLFEALQTARIGVFPSYAESYGIAPFEAMTNGAPTIYTRLGPGPELLNHEEEVLLIDPNHPNEIAEAIIRLLEDDALAARLSQLGPQLVKERFSIDAILPQNEAFYQGCIEAFKQTR
ncbi:MAG: glycosyltransferase family 4 protein [Chloroflexota bacterium]